jgi:hypothetical protein
VVGLKATIPIAIAIFIVGLAGVGAYIQGSQGNNSNHTITEVSGTQTVTVSQLSTVTESKTVTTTLSNGSNQPAVVTLVISCSGCQVGIFSQHEYSGTVTNGTQGHQQSTNINGSGTSTFSILGSQAELATGSWSVNWFVTASGNTGTLEAKAYFNSALISDKTVPASTGSLSGYIHVTAY